MDVIGKTNIFTKFLQKQEALAAIGFVLTIFVNIGLAVMDLAFVYIHRKQREKQKGVCNNKIWISVIFAKYCVFGVAEIIAIFLTPSECFIALSCVYPIVIIFGIRMCLYEKLPEVDLKTKNCREAQQTYNQNDDEEVSPRPDDSVYPRYIKAVIYNIIASTVLLIFNKDNELDYTISGIESHLRKKSLLLGAICLSAAALVIHILVKTNMDEAARCAKLCGELKGVKKAYVQAKHFLIELVVTLALLVVLMIICAKIAVGFFAQNIWRKPFSEHENIVFMIAIIVPPLIFKIISIFIFDMGIKYSGPKYMIFIISHFSAITGTEFILIMFFDSAKNYDPNYMSMVLFSFCMCLLTIATINNDQNESEITLDSIKKCSCFASNHSGQKYDTLFTLSEKTNPSQSVTTYYYS